MIARVCAPGTYPDADVSKGETPCPPGHVGTVLDMSFFRRTCHNPNAILQAVNTTSLHALRCFSPSLAIGACTTETMYTYEGAGEKCFSLMERGVSDWRLPISIEEAGLMCGR